MLERSGLLSEEQEKGKIIKLRFIELEPKDTNLENGV